MTAERAALDVQGQRIQAESFRLTLDQNALNAIMRRRHQCRLPPVYDARNLFNTPGAGTNDPPLVNRAVETPMTGAPVQPRTMDLPHLDMTPPQHVPTLPGHYSNPLNNMIAAVTRLAALPVEGESLAAIEVRRARQLVQTTVSQQFLNPLSKPKL